MKLAVVMYTRSMIRLFLSLFALSIIPEIQAQDKEIEDVKILDFFQYDRSYDSTASAIILFDIGRVNFDASLDVYMERHTRMKVLNESGLKYGNIELAYNKEFDQRIYDVNAATYSLDKGELKEYRLSNKEILDTKIFDKIHAKKFSMPGLEPGSIIDISYRKKMGNPFHMPDWKFHNEIPVEYSSFYMKVPWKLYYHMVFKGTDTLYTTQSGNYNHGNDRGYYVEITKKDLPPVKTLPFMDSSEDFISEVYTQLSYAYTDRRNKIEYLKDWKEVVDEIKNHPDIGKQRTNKSINKKVDELINGASSKIEILERIYEYVSTSIVWNNIHQVYSIKGIRDTFKENTGSSGDMNLLLYEMLKTAGIEVYYALTSTRDHGNVMTNYPIINQFNHILNIALINGRMYILDATEGYRSALLPPIKNLYQVALVIQDNTYGWVEIKPSKRSISTSFLNYSIHENGKTEGSLSINSIGYEAQHLRQLISKHGKAETAQKILKGQENVSIDSVFVHGMNMNDSRAVFYTHFNLDLFDGEGLKNVVYLNPLLFLADTEQPFVSVTRNLPIYFPYPVQESKQVNITLPEGYYVDEMPETVSMVLPDNQGSFNFQVKVNDSQVEIHSDFELKNAFYKPEFYKTLREMFIRLTDSHSASLVLKKKILNE